MLSFIADIIWRMGMRLIWWIFLFPVVWIISLPFILVISAFKPGPYVDAVIDLMSAVHEYWARNGLWWVR
jgi:hypothetical protein